VSSESQNASDAFMMSQGRSHSVGGSEGLSQQPAGVPEESDGDDGAPGDGNLDAEGASPQKPVAATAVDVPNTKKELKALPQETLLDMCKQLGLEVTGTGHKGKAKKGEYVEAVYASFSFF